MVMASFYMVRLMDKLGIEGKVYTAGARKGGVNPMSKTTEEVEMDVRSLLDVTHTEFIDFVRERRMGKLKQEHHDDIFSGAVFGAVKGVEVGLVDGMYSVMESTVAELIGETKFKMVEFTIKEVGIMSLFGLAEVRKWFEGKMG